MPAHEKEILWAEEEGVELTTLLAPKQVAGNGTVSGLECTRMALGEFDRSGRRRPEPVPDSTELVEADTIIAAIGQMPDVPEEATGRLDLSRRGTFQVDPNSLATSIEGVFGAGDAVSGPATVIGAIAQGERAAIAVDRYLRGEPLDSTILVGHAPPCPEETSDSVDAEEGEVEERPREVVPCLDARARAGNFKEVEIGFDEAAAKCEASRCLHCHRE